MSIAYPWLLPLLVIPLGLLAWVWMRDGRHVVLPFDHARTGRGLGLKIILNLADVPYIDSAGLGEIVRTYTTVSRQGGKLKLLNLTKRIQDLLAITKLLTVFDTYDSEAEAIKSYK